MEQKYKDVFRGKMGETEAAEWFKFGPTYRKLKSQKIIFNWHFMIVGFVDYLYSLTWLSGVVTWAELFLFCLNSRVSLGDTRKGPRSNFRRREIRANILTPSTCCLPSCTLTNSLSLMEIDPRPKSSQSCSDCELSLEFQSDDHLKFAVMSC